MIVFDEAIVELTLEGPFVYALLGSSVRSVPTLGGEATTAAVAPRRFSCLITDESYHYSFYFDTDIVLVRSPLLANIATSHGNSFAVLANGTGIPNAIQGFKSSDSHLYVAYSAATSGLYRVPKTGGSLSFVDGSENLGAKAFAVDEDFIYGLSNAAITRLDVEGGSVSPLAGAIGGEVFTEIALTETSIVVASSDRIASASKTSPDLETLVEIEQAYQLHADTRGSSVVFVQALGDAETCSDGSILYQSSEGEPARKLSTLPPGCVGHLAFDDDAVYWTHGEEGEVFKVGPW